MVNSIGESSNWHLKLTVFNRHTSSIGIHLQSTYPVVQDVVVRGVRVLVPMRGAVWTVKPHHVYRAELSVYVFGVSCVWVQKRGFFMEATESEVK